MVLAGASLLRRELSVCPGAAHQGKTAGTGNSLEVRAVRGCDQTRQQIEVLLGNRPGRATCERGLDGFVPFGGQDGRDIQPDGRPVLALRVAAGLAFTGGPAIFPTAGPSRPVLDNVSEALAGPPAKTAGRTAGRVEMAGRFKGGHALVDHAPHHEPDCLGLIGVDLHPGVFLPSHHPVPERRRPARPEPSPSDGGHA